MIDDEFTKLNTIIANEKNAREETEEAFLDMLRSIINKIKAELENEKKQREATEENLLTLLEETCSKLDAAAKM
jgi:CRISPR/Cas system CSM-associated protein Csm2 small subunit